jgi:hypothetical protein
VVGGICQFRTVASRHVCVPPNYDSLAQSPDNVPGRFSAHK